METSIHELTPAQFQWVRERTFMARKALNDFRRAERNLIFSGRALLLLNVVFGTRAIAAVFDPSTRNVVPWLLSFAIHVGLFVYVFRKFESRWTTSRQEARDIELEIRAVENEIRKREMGLS